MGGRRYSNTLPGMFDQHLFTLHDGSSEIMTNFDRELHRLGDWVRVNRGLEIDWENTANWAVPDGPNFVNATSKVSFTISTICLDVMTTPLWITWS